MTYNLILFNRELVTLSRFQSEPTLSTLYDLTGDGDFKEAMLQAAEQFVKQFSDSSVQFSLAHLSLS